MNARRCLLPLVALLPIACEATPAPVAPPAPVVAPPPPKAPVTVVDLATAQPAPPPPPKPVASAAPIASAAPVASSDSGAPATPDDPLSAQGNMWGEAIGDSNGFGGLGLVGAGEGAGGTGEGIGIGSIGTLGHGSGTGQGFGSGHGRLGGAHRTPPPRIAMGAASVAGRLPPDVVKRIVRQNFGRFRLCYENGLRTNPKLEGKVNVKFVISRKGNVSSVTDGGGSTMPDKTVKGCVLRAFQPLSFPEPEGGIVVVNYPLQFEPGGDPPKAAPTPPAAPPPSASAAPPAPPPAPPAASTP